MSARQIGSRGSDLALWQSRTVLAALNAAAPAPAWHSDITVITTRGDVDQSPYLAGSVEKGFFTRELEIALLERRIDLVVHSLKDLPTAEPAGPGQSHHPAARQRGRLAADPARVPRAARRRPAAAEGRRARRRVVAAPRRLVRPLRAAGEVRAAARQRADASAAPRRRPERRRHRARRRGTHPAAARPLRLRADRALARMVGAGAGAGRAGRAVPRGRCRHRNPDCHARRSRLRRTPRAGSANSCASSRAAVPRPSAVTSSATAHISASPPSAAGPRAASNFRQIFQHERIHNVTPSSAQPSPAANPSSSQKLPLARSAELYSRAEALIPAGVSSPVRAFRKVGGTPVFFKEASGAYAVDEDGNRYLDLCMAWGPLILGHAHPRVVEAVQRAAGRRPGVRHRASARGRARRARAGRVSVRAAGALRGQRHRGRGHRGAHRARQQWPAPHPQVRRLLSRPRRSADGQGRQRRDHAGPGRQRRRAGAGGGRHAGDSAG